MSTNRVRINGTVLRHGQTFVGRIDAMHVTGKGRLLRYSSLKCVRVKTARAVSVAMNPHFSANARGKRGVTHEIRDALIQFEQACKKPGLTNAEAAAAVAALVLTRKDVVLREVPIVFPVSDVSAIGNWESTCDLNGALHQYDVGDDDDDWALCRTPER
jgi:hypothetical protein